MIGVRDILGIGRFLLSKGFVDRVSSLISSYRKPPAWSKDISVLDATIKRRDRELSSAFREKISETLKEKDFSEDFQTRFRAVFGELVLNGFTHGCANDRDRISLRVAIFGIGASIETTNSNRKKRIDISIQSIRDKADELKKSQSSGRGLPLIFRISDQFEILNDGRTVKAVLYDNDEKVEYLSGDVTLIYVGDYLGDYLWKVHSALENAKGHVVLVFTKSRHDPASSILRVIDRTQTYDSVRDFSVVIDPAYQTFLGDIASTFPKFKSFYPSIQAAIAALSPTSGEKPVARSTRKKAK